jgi:DNA processing protein
VTAPDACDSGARSDAPARGTAPESPAARTAPDARAIQVLRRDDPRFPLSLLAVRPQPEVLYARGDLALLEQRLVAIIGSRTPTTYGSRVAYQAAQAAARAGLVVVSGMARGLDTRAHRGALDAGGKTIAVLGSGVDVPYPKANRDLYADVLASGLLLSEEEPGADPRPGSFPRRNRLISGLAECLLVVEGKAAGGTSNTAAFMLAAGKPILAVPGRIEDEVAEGPNKLIRDGAGVYLGPEDLLARFGLEWSRVVAKERRAQAMQLDAFLAGSPELLRAEAAVFDLLVAEPLHVDVIAAKAALDASTLLAALSSLELKGLAVQLPGKRFCLAA